MRPNVVLVLVDDMGYGDFGVFSEGACRTPVLDGSVTDGVCLTQHYSGSCVCAPSRGALLTGRYLTDVLTKEAGGFIHRHRDELFFLHLTYNAPHFPLQAPDEDVNPFRESGRYTEGVNQIYGMISRVDQGCRRSFRSWTTTSWPRTQS